MSKIKKLSLINGKFEEEEAREILMNLFSTKIQFHELRNFSSQIRFSQDDEIAQNRIPELKKSKEKLRLILLEAKAKNKRLIITSDINITLSDD